MQVKLVKSANKHRQYLKKKVYSLVLWRSLRIDWKTSTYKAVFPEIKRFRQLRLNKQLLAWQDNFFSVSIPMSKAQYGVLQYTKSTEGVVLHLTHQTARTAQINISVPDNKASKINAVVWKYKNSSTITILADHCNTKWPRQHNQNWCKSLN